MSKGLKWVVLIVAVLLLPAQFIRPARTNPTADQSLAIESQLRIDPRVTMILARSCADCHTNNTRWPWYSNVAPVSWFVIKHVNDGRGQLNLSEWGKYGVRRQGEKLREVCDMVKSGAMPLSSYTPLHADSRLSAADVTLLCEWTRTERNRITSR